MSSSGQPLTLKQKLKLWERSPLFTTRIVLRCGICYTVLLIIIAAFILLSGTDVVEFSVQYDANAVCGDNIKIDGDGVYRDRTCATVNSGALSSVGEQTTIEEIEIELAADMTGPIFVYTEYEGFHQNHIRFIRSAQGFNSYRQLRTGDCMKYQKDRTSCEDKEYSYFLGKNEYQDAVYRLWHPKSIGSSALGCWLWWSEQSTQCLIEGGSGAACDIEPHLKNRVYYPCGLGPKAWTQGRDTYAVQGHRIGMKAEDIAFSNDYEGQFRNLNPDGVFDPSKNQNKDYKPNFPPGSTFKDVLNMHFLRHHPPVVCDNDPLGLVHPDLDQNTGDPKCSNYDQFDFDATKNGADCQYSGVSNKINPVDGTKISCSNRIPNEAGWGIENSHFMNWMRLSALTTFRKLYGKIDGNWKKGDRKKIFIANRMNMLNLAGPDSEVKKRIVFTTMSSYGGLNGNTVGILILIVGLIAMIGTGLIWFKHSQNPRPLESVHQLAWGGFRSSDQDGGHSDDHVPVVAEKGDDSPTQSALMRAFKKKPVDRTMIPRMSPAYVPQVFRAPSKDNPGSYNERNGIRTTKFRATILHWLPMSLFYQFRRAANQYFLLITVLTAMPFSPKMLAPRVGTLAFVLLWTAVKDRFEDYQREKSDRAENTRRVQVLKKQGSATQQSVESSPVAKLMAGFINFESKCYAVSYRMFCCCCWSAEPVEQSKDEKGIDANEITPGDGGGIEGSYWEPCEWQNVRTSDIVKVAKNEMFPADIVILATSNGSDGHCFIDTKNLDGETNLKYKVAAHAIIGSGEKSGDEGFAGLEINVEAPHENMNGFKGSFAFGKSEDKKPLFLDNIVLRGCALRNTDWVVGFVCYTGNDTKVMLNSRDAPAKVPHMQHVLNILLRGLFISLGIAVIVCVIGSCIWEGDNKKATFYLQQSGATKGRTDTAGEFIDVDILTVLVKTAIYIVTFSHLIPMSLYVAVEITKLTLIYFILVDPTMVCPETGQSALPRNSDLVEELGQVEIIFSDKTGTLTCNKMEFVRGSVAELVLGPPNNDALKKAREKQKNDSEKGYDLHGDLTGYNHMFTKDVDPGVKKAMLDYHLLLAVCHAVLIDPESKMYQGASPDEVALVRGAAQCGVVLEDVQFGEIKIRLADGTMREYSLKEVMEFDSDRKRMSVVVHNKTENTIELLLKGADMMVLQRLKQDANGQPDGFPAPNCKNHEHLQAFSSEGLRTLIAAKKTLKILDDPEKNKNLMERNNGFDYDVWAKKYKDATIDLQDREAKLAECGEEIEVDLDYVGITAVEDLLQDGVPETIELLKQAGLRVWVLTGDKVETAIDIGYSCALLKKEGMKLLRLVNLIDVEKIKPALESAIQTIEEEHRKGLQVGMAMDGFSMTTLTSSGASGDLQKLFFDVVMNVDAVICCRVAPKQKAYVVKTVQKHRPSLITLSVGDGANDVAMIQEAHVGVGIRGVEGTQAVQASDFAVSQFRFLQGLLLDHGRAAYRRVATFICYYFYKNIALVASDLMWAPLHGFSGQIVFPSWYTTNYNALWTSWPCIFAFSLDRDVSPTIARANAYLYAAGPANVYFNAKIFFSWVGLAFWHGSIAFWIPFLAYGADSMNSDGIVGGFWWASVLCFTVIITVVASKLLIITLSWRDRKSVV